MAKLKKSIERMIEFFKEVRYELRKVSWPDRHTTSVYTWVVAGTVVVVGLIIWVIDVGLSSVLRLVIK